MNRGLTLNSGNELLITMQLRWKDSFFDERWREVQKVSWLVRAILKESGFKLGRDDDNGGQPAM